MNHSVEVERHRFGNTDHIDTPGHEEPTMYRRNEAIQDLERRITFHEAQIENHPNNRVLRIDARKSILRFKRELKALRF